MGADWCWTCTWCSTAPRLRKASISGGPDLAGPSQSQNSPPGFPCVAFHIELSAAFAGRSSEFAGKIRIFQSLLDGGCDLGRIERREIAKRISTNLRHRHDVRRQHRSTRAEGFDQDVRTVLARGRKDDQ